MTTVPIKDIRIDGGTQVRAAISENVVAEYADRMLAGDVFPSVMLFHDGNDYYVADGFHRVLAAKRNGLIDIPADVTAGTKADALWHALGANRKNGQRLTERDVKHAIELALAIWPDRSGKQLSEQIGCSQRYVASIREHVRATANLPDRVKGKDGKSYPAARPKEPVAIDPKREAIAALINEGRSSRAICAELGVRGEIVAEIRRELGVAKPDTSRDAVRQRRERMREMAASGHSSRQIAAAVGMSELGCKATMRDVGIDVPADRAIGKSNRHDSTRIIEHIVMDAENLTADVGLIDFAALDAARFEEWVTSLTTSKRALDAFIRQLVKEKQKHVQAA